MVLGSKITIFRMRFSLAWLRFRSLAGLRVIWRKNWKMSELPCYTILSLPTDLEAPNEQQLKSELEKGDIKAKIAALKKVLHLILNGDKIPGLLMTIIRFVLPCQVMKEKLRFSLNSPSNFNRILYLTAWLKLCKGKYDDFWTINCVKVKIGLFTN